MTTHLDPTIIVCGDIPDTATECVILIEQTSTKKKDNTDEPSGNNGDYVAASER